jgi:mono/diheme cytochrome c family protein
MNEETKKQINEKYERELQKGEKFWPDSIFKDVIVALGLFLVLVLLATFVGVHDSPKADPSDTSYIPRPEWYFLFLFKFLALYGQIPVIGKIEWIATVLIPGIAVGALTLLPFLERTPDRYYAKRALPIAIMVIFIVSTVTLTMLSEVPTVSADGNPLIGMLQTIGGLVVPGLGMLALFIMAYTLKQQAVNPMKWTAIIASLLMVGFTVVTLVIYEPVEKEKAYHPTALVDQIAYGQELYSIHCLECHGDDGSVSEIVGVAGLEGVKISIISSRDVLYTVNDASMAEIIAFGRPDSGMPPLGKAYNPEGLTRAEIDYIVTFMRYTWDDRFEAPPVKPLYPALAEGEVPSYDVHIQPIVTRYCLSCHRPGKDNNNYWMTTYEEVINTGDNAPVMEPGDMNSIMLVILQGTPILDDNGDELIGVMPPNKPLRADIVDVWIRWVMAGMPKTVEEAQSLSTTPAP